MYYCNKLQTNIHFDGVVNKSFVIYLNEKNEKYVADQGGHQGEHGDKGYGHPSKITSGILFRVVM